MTSLGPSLAVVRDLRTTGKANYSVIPFAKLPVSAGTHDARRLSDVYCSW